MNTYNFNTPSKKPKREMVPKSERSTPASQRSLRMDLEDYEDSPAPSSSLPTPVALTPTPMDDETEELLERFWASTGVECAAAISARLASAAVSIASRYVLKQMLLEKATSGLGGTARLGKVGWPKRKGFGVKTPELPATWRLAAKCSKNVEAMVTPPRNIRSYHGKRKHPELDETDTVLGICPLSPMVKQLGQAAVQQELVAMRKLDARDRVRRARMRKAREEEREARNKFPLLVDEIEEEDLPDLLEPEVSAHDGHGCEYDRKEESSDDEDPGTSQNVARGNAGVNINILNCQH